MRYLIRSVKYFIYLTVVLCLMITILIMLGVVEKDPSTIFRNGYSSYWQIALMIALLSLVYPRFGYVSRKALIPGSFDQIMDGIMEYMNLRGYTLTAKDGENLTFRLSSPVSRITRQFEDTLTFTRNITGYDIEGPGKDVTRVISGLEHKFNEDR